MAPTNSIDLTDKVAVITGSGKENGIGAGIALALACAGARVATNYVSETTEPRAAEVVRKVEAVAGKRSIIAVKADISTSEGAKKLIEDTLTGFGVDHIDILGKIPLCIWIRDSHEAACSPDPCDLSIFIQHSC